MSQHHGDKHERGIPTIEQWRERGEQVALATVVKTLGAARRWREDGCVVRRQHGRLGQRRLHEGTVFDDCQQALKTGQGRLLHFGVADDDAWDVGLACGGTIDVFIEPLD